MKVNRGKFKHPTDRYIKAALRRAARNVRIENRRLDLPIVVWKNGKTVAVPA